jgi:hypothetical protein
MKTLAMAALAFGIFAAPVSFAYAQTYSAEGWTNPAPDSATSPMHGSHDKGAIVRVLNNNGIKTQTNQDPSAYEAYFNPQQSTETQPQGANLVPYLTDHQSARE